MQSPLRSAILFLSRRQGLRRWLEGSRISRRLISRFIAGQSLDDAIAVARRLQAEGIAATLDHLGENVTTLDEARASLDAALAALQALRQAGLASTLSIKLTQFGLDLSETACRSNVSTLVEAAKNADRRVEIDMESSDYTSRTLEIVRDLHARYGNVRAVLQAYLHRSESDIDTLCRDGIPVRLCKGAYLEPAEVAYQDKSEVDSHYRRLMRRLLELGTDPAIASHDETMVREAMRFPPERLEFQMLYGIRRNLQSELIRKGFRLRLYVPYGSAWYPYFMRRLAERPANVWFVLRNLVRN